MFYSCFCFFKGEEFRRGVWFFSWVRGWRYKEHELRTGREEIERISNRAEKKWGRRDKRCGVRGRIISRRKGCEKGKVDAQTRT